MRWTRHRPPSPPLEPTCHPWAPARRRVPRCGSCKLHSRTTCSPACSSCRWAATCRQPQQLCPARQRQPWRRRGGLQPRSPRHLLPALPPPHRPVASSWWLHRLRSSCSAPLESLVPQQGRSPPGCQTAAPCHTAPLPPQPRHRRQAMAAGRTGGRQMPAPCRTAPWSTNASVHAAMTRAAAVAMARCGGLPAAGGAAGNQPTVPLEQLAPLWQPPSSLVDALAGVLQLPHNKHALLAQGPLHGAAPLQCLRVRCSPAAWLSAATPVCALHFSDSVVC